MYLFAKNRKYEQIIFKQSGFVKLFDDLLKLMLESKQHKTLSQESNKEHMSSFPKVIFSAADSL